MKRDSAAGFTLIELAIAVALLGLALPILITMQTSFAESYMRDRYATRAALYTQYLLALAETSNKPPDAGENEVSVADALREAGYFDGLRDSEQGVIDELQSWKLRQSVSEVGIPPIEDALRRIDINISWGEGSENAFQVTYFMKGKGVAPAIPQS